MPREPITQERLVEAARHLIEVGGVESVSMRKVAAEVGVAPTVIYWHVGGREALLHAVLDAMIADLPPLSAKGSSPRQRILSVARAVRSQLADSVAAQQVASAVGRSAELFFPGQVALAKELSAAGLKGKAAAQAVRSLLVVIGGFLVVEDNYRQRAPGSLTTQQLWAAIDDPAIDAATRSAMGGVTDFDALFTVTVGNLLDGVLQ